MTLGLRATIGRPAAAMCVACAIALQALAGASGQSVVPQSATAGANPAPEPAPAAAARSASQAPQPAAAWTPQAIAVLRAIAAELPAHGVDRAIDGAQATPDDAAPSAEAIDRLAQSLAGILAGGAVNPAIAEPSWHIPSAGSDVSLDTLRALPPDRLDATLRALAPQDPTYVSLMSAYADALLEPDSIETLARRTSLRASLERWRWLPRNLPGDRLEIHIPQFEARLFRAGVLSATHRVIVGARATPTPSFTALIEGVTLNPTWRPPAKIAFGEILPMMRRNPRRATAQGYRLVSAAGAILKPQDVDLRARPFPFAIIQIPGPGNALGRVKLELPNPFAIYIHDTPAQSLFAQTNRARSHGCVRAQAAEDLAVEVLNRPDIDRTALDAQIARGTSQRITLAQSLPVYVLYMTAGPDTTGSISYAPDVYGRDRRLAIHLAQTRPAKIK
jgi:hypothetical protein